jgi:allantoin racemase
MRIWYQLLAPNTRHAEFIASVQALCNRIAAPGTTVEVHGTDPGAHGDNYRFFEYYDIMVVLKNALKVRKQGGYDAFVLGNSLDPGLVGLREILDIPVLTVMEVCCHTACTMGEKFGIVVPNEKFMPKYREIVAGYGLQGRSAGVSTMNYKRIAELNGMFVDERAAQATIDGFTEASKVLIERGAEVLIPIGPPMSLLAHKGVREVDGAIVMDGYSLLVKATEAMVAMHKLTGKCVSRRGLYGSPPPDLMRTGAELHGFQDLL